MTASSRPRPRCLAGAALVVALAGSAVVGFAGGAGAATWPVCASAIFADDLESGFFELWSSVSGGCSESEPNDDLPNAGAYCRTWTAAIGSVGDVDLFAFPVLVDGSTLEIETDDGALASCPSIDTLLALVDELGDPVAADDDGGVGFCSRIVAAGLDAGWYYVETRETDDDATIGAYGVHVTLTPPFGGEVEPNDDSGSAEPYCSLFSGAIAPLADRDWVSVAVDAGDEIEFTVLDAGDGDCAAGLVDSFLTLYDTDGATPLASDDDSSAGLCSRVTHLFASSGTYFLELEEFGDNSEIPGYRLQAVVLVP